MKALIKYLFVACTLIIITACGGSSDKADNRSEFSTYKEALAAEDFEAVHKILSQAEMEVDKYKFNESPFVDKYGFTPDDIDKVKLEVLKSELTFLVSQNNEDLNDRIIFLINENNELLKNDKHDEYCNHVATLAANQQNEGLVKKIAQQFRDPAIFFANSAVSDFGKGKDFYSEMIYDYLKQGIDIPRPQLGMIKSDYYGDLDQKYDKYIKATNTYNKLCIAAIKDALDKDDVDMAKKILRFVKKNIKYEDLGDWCQVVEKNGYTSVYEAFKVTEDDSDIKEAKELLD